MASKAYFVRGKEIPFIERSVEYKFVPGFAISQRKKNVAAVHEAIQKRYGNKEKRILEVSSRSDLEIGRRLSAFNLHYGDYPVECWFQSSKIFNNEDNPNYEWLRLDPAVAKGRAKEAGQVTGFRFEGYNFDIYPASACYDYIYCKALHANKKIDKDELAKFNVFTDVEFNADRQLNCQARSVCIYTYLYKHHLLKEALSSPEKFIEIVY